MQSPLSLLPNQNKTQLYFLLNYGRKLQIPSVPQSEQGQTISTHIYIHNNSHLHLYPLDLKWSRKNITDTHKQREENGERVSLSDSHLEGQQVILTMEMIMSNQHWNKSLLRPTSRLIMKMCVQLYDVKVCERARNKMVTLSSAQRYPRGWVRLQMQDL